MNTLLLTVLIAGGATALMFLRPTNLKGIAVLFLIMVLTLGALVTLVRTTAPATESECSRE